MRRVLDQKVRRLGPAVRRDEFAQLGTVQQCMACHDSSLATDTLWRPHPIGTGHDSILYSFGAGSTSSSHPGQDFGNWKQNKYWHVAPHAVGLAPQTEGVYLK